jgi:hypothetical protein
MTPSHPNNTRYLYEISLSPLALGWVRFVPLLFSRIFFIKYYASHPSAFSISFSIYLTFIFRCAIIDM